MRALQPRRSRRPTGRARAALSAACLALAGLSIIDYRDDRVVREKAESFARKFTIDQRRPRLLETARVAEAGDLAFTPLVDAALEDTLESVQLAEVTPEMRRLWVDAMIDLDDELVAARELMLDAIAIRPGWAFHEMMLGQTVYVRDRRSSRPELYEQPERWSTPLRAAASLGPGADLVWNFLGGAYLETWNEVSPKDRSDSTPVLREAFKEPRFIESALARAVAALGTEEAIALLPSGAGPLGIARQVIAGLDIRSAARLHKRWLEAEQRERVQGLQRIEERVQHEDVVGARLGCRSWLAAHSVGELDGPESRKQLARIVELWPEDRSGDWGSDPRTELIRYFLAGRQRDVDGPALARMAAGLSKVPGNVRARTLLLAGDRYGLDQVLRSNETLASFDWTVFLTELARHELSEGSVDAAQAALDNVARPALKECEVLLARRELARAQHAVGVLEMVTKDLSAAVRSTFAAESFSSSGTLSLCLDPESDEETYLKVRLAAPTTAFVSYGWDGARLGYAVVEKDAVISVPLAGLRGRRSFSTYSVVGPVVKAVEAWKETTPSPTAEGRGRSFREADDHAAPSTVAKVAGIAGKEKLKSTTP
jgi:hypothetical protein